MSTPNIQKPRLEDIALVDIRGSGTNPRKHFAPEPLAELAESIRAQGIRQPILIRPKAGATPYEIVAGERRFRAAKLAGLEVAPCLISEMSDREALEVQVVENLQRSDLTELEEALSYQAMLDLKDETSGGTVYTAEALASRFGVERTHIYRRLTLLRLAPAAQDALQAGDLPATHAVYVARIPSPEAQTAALKKILTPQHKAERLSRAETHELIGREFMQSLRGAPFRLDDAELLPAVGPCSTCPKMSDNCGHLFEGEDGGNKKKVCTDPGCYRAKLDAGWKKQTETAAAEGKLVLDEKQSRAVFPIGAGFTAGDMDWRSPYVLLSEKPAAYLLKPEVVDTVGTWRRLVEDAEKQTAEAALATARATIKEDEALSKEAKRDALALLEKNPPSGMQVPRVIARDQSGAARDLVDRKLAMLAIEAAGEPIFAARTTAAPTAEPDDFAKERKAQQEEAKQRLMQNLIALEEVHAALVAKWEPSPVWEALFPLALEHAGFDGAWLLAKWQDLKFTNNGTADGNVYAVVGAWASALVASERQALVPLLLMGAKLKNSGPGEDFETFCETAEVEFDFEALAKKARVKAKHSRKVKDAVADEEGTE